MKSEILSKSASKSTVNNSSGTSLNTHLICEQIDIVIMGPKSIELIQTLINKKLQTKSTSSSNKYIKSLRNLFPDDSQIQFKISERTIDPKQSMKQWNKMIHKFSTTILTETFWLQYNFYLFDQKAYDPLLANILSNHMDLCIFANDQNSPASTQLKTLITKNPQVSSKQGQKEIYDSFNTQNKIRNQLILEAKILNNLHQIYINQFKSVLTLRVISPGRIVQETNNLRLTRNQILRWALDRYFQNVFHVKLREQLGDQLESQQPELQTQNCAIM